MVTALSTVEMKNLLYLACEGLKMLSITSWHIDAETVETVTDFMFLGSRITVYRYCSHEIKTLAPWKKSYDQPRQHIKKKKHYFANKDLSSQSYGFSSSRVWI